ncbi:MAG: hypothetical protein NUV69_04080 [Candidatus Curtissbacteria bacterium]|nr:hypothetical protein [Candidatus Curtissbacteria bacterium]
MSKKVPEVSKENLIILTFGLLIGFVVSLPHILGSIDNKGAYQPFSVNSAVSYSKEEAYTYAAQVQHLVKGYLIGDPYIWEYRNGLSPYLGELGSIVPVSILSILLSSVPKGFMASDFVFPFTLFLLISKNLKNLGFNLSFTLFAASAVLVIPFLSVLIPKITSYGTVLTGIENGPLLFTRTPHPQISDVYLFCAIFTSIWFLKSKNPKRVIILPIILGLSLYSSVYVASTIILASLIIAPFAAKNLDKKQITKILIIGAIVSLPLLLNFYLTREILSKEFILRFSQEKNFLFPIQIRYLLIAFLLYKFRPRDPIYKVLFIYVVCAAVLIDFHQIILGRDLQGDHWITRVIAPLATLSLLLITYTFFKKANYRLWTLATLSILIFGFYVQNNWYQNNKSYLTQDTRTASLIMQINTMGNNYVVGTLNTSLGDEIRATTGIWTYLSPGDRSYISTAEQIQRACDLLVLQKGTSTLEEANEALLYELGLEAKNKKTVEKVQRELSQCAQKNNTTPSFKLDYLIVESENGEYSLKKI